MERRQGSLQGPSVITEETPAGKIMIGTSFGQQFIIGESEQGGLNIRSRHEGIIVTFVTGKVVELREDTL
jgi:hypothetical protein